ncbi:MAG: RusA family crossover junction endodeoxyribonuclease, partial [Gemmataceae bacterium]|nr:RusA family crossover junction endodeoxyribonuclease [Gemmataceae bacterium]
MAARISAAEAKKLGVVVPPGKSTAALPRVDPTSKSSVPPLALIRGGVEVTTESDRITASLLLTALGCESPREIPVVTVACEPRSKTRPRFGAGRVYSDPAQKTNQELLSFFLRPVFPEPLTSNVAVACLFYRSTRHSIDTDNLLKQVLDTGNKLCWRDDRQVTAVAGVTGLDRINPRVVIAVGVHRSSMDRETGLEVACLRCGKVIPFRKPCESELAISKNIGRYCSRQCVHEARGEKLSVPIPCIVCRTLFKRQNEKRRYCSNPCRLQALAAKMRGKRVHTPSHCRSCG